MKKDNISSSNNTKSNAITHGIHIAQLQTILEYSNDTIHNID